MQRTRFIRKFCFPFFFQFYIHAKNKLRIHPIYYKKRYIYIHISYSLIQKVCKNVSLGEKLILVSHAAGINTFMHAMRVCMDTGARIRAYFSLMRINKRIGDHVAVQYRIYTLPVYVNVHTCINTSTVKGLVIRFQYPSISPRTRV